MNRYQLNQKQANKVMKLIGCELLLHDVVTLEMPERPVFDKDRLQVSVFVFRKGREQIRGDITIAQAFSI